MDIGVYKIALPFEEPTEKVLSDVIQTKTLPIFSLYHPYYATIEFDTNKLKKIGRGSNWDEYELPDVFHERQILFVRYVQYKDNTVTGVSFYGGLPLSGNMVQETMIANATANLASKLIPKITFEWKPPRVLRIYNMINTAVIEVNFAFNNDKSLASIPDTCYDSFLRLATLDCKMFLYNTLKHYAELNSMYGNIALKIDDWQNAESDRNALIEQWDNTYHMDLGLFEYI